MSSSVDIRLLLMERTINPPPFYNNCNCIWCTILILTEIASPFTILLVVHRSWRMIPIMLTKFLRTTDMQEMMNLQVKKREHCLPCRGVSNLFHFFLASEFSLQRLNTQFENTVSDPLRLRRFLEFLKKEHATENLNFYIQTLSYLKIKDDAERQR